MRIVLAAFALALAAPPVAGADTDLGAVTHDTPVATYGETAVWSAYDAASGGFNLMSWTASAGVAAVPVPGRKAAFDADLGPAPDGTLRAVYSRAGRLYVFDFATGSERPLSIRGKRPHVWWDRVTFIHKGALRQRLIGGTLRRTIFTRLPKGFSSFDVGRSVLAWATNRQRSEGALAELRTRPIAGGRERRVYRSTSGALSHAVITGVNFVNFDAFGAVKERYAGSGQRVLRYDWSAKRVRQARGRANVLDAGLVSANRLFYLRTDTESQPGCEDASLGGCHLLVSDPLSF